MSGEFPDAVFGLAIGNREKDAGKQRPIRPLVHTVFFLYTE